MLIMTVSNLHMMIMEKHHITTYHHEQIYRLIKSKHIIIIEQSLTYWYPNNHARMEQRGYGIKFWVKEEDRKRERVKKTWKKERGKWM